jgi:choline kinase
MKVLILAAGLGSRLGSAYPKPLTILSNGQSIMQAQVKAFLRYFDIDDIYVVVGFKKDLIMEAFSELTYVYNDYFDTSNTARSLYKGLKKLRGHDVIWANGDVVFDHRVIAELLASDRSGMVVNTLSVGKEEIKYTLDEHGYIDQVSKEVTQALGEAVGINKVIEPDISRLLTCLETCDDSDYFEKGLEYAISQGMKIRPIDVGERLCIEIDFVDDLELVNKQLKNGD